MTCWHVNRRTIDIPTEEVIKTSFAI